MKKINKIPKIVFWFPRISGVIFFLYMFYITYYDVRMIAYLYPLVVQLLSAVIVFMLTVLCWKKAKIASLMAFVFGLFFVELSYNGGISFSVLFSGVWLLMTSFLYWIEVLYEKPRKITQKAHQSSYWHNFEKRPIVNLKLKPGFYRIFSRHKTIRIKAGVKS